MIYGESRARLSVSDDASIAAYGRRYMLFSEDATSEIDTAVEAGRMLEGALADLKDAEVTLDYERSYLQGVELGDEHVIPANPRKHPVLTVGVIGYSHALDWRPSGTFRSVIRTERRSLAAKVRWRKLDPKMVFVSLLEPVGMADEGATWYQVADLTPPT
jgi:CHASE2 domain-containing sensor protein